MLKSIVVPSLALALAAFHGCSSGGGDRADAGSGGAQAGGGGGNTPDPGSGGTAGVGDSGGSGGAPGSDGGSGGAPGNDGGTGGAPGNDGGTGGTPGNDGGTGDTPDVPLPGCPSLATSWVGDYDITRLVIRQPDGVDRPPLTKALSRAGIRDQNGDVWAIIRDSFVKIVADGSISATYHMSQNGTYGGYQEGAGRWIAEGTSTLSVDWSGDSYYRRKFAVRVEGCALKLVKTFPADFANSTFTREYIEVDLLKR